MANDLKANVEMHQTDVEGVTPVVAAVQTELFEPAPAVVTVAVKVVVTLNVPAAFLSNVSINAAVIREHLEDMAVSLYGTVGSVDIA